MKDIIKILGVPIYSRSIETGPLSNPSQAFVDAVRGAATDSGVNVDHNVAVTISAVWRAISVVAGTLAFLPLHVHRKDKNNGRTYLSDHPVQKLIDYPSQLHSDFIFRQTLQAMKMLWGNAYAVIQRNESTGVPQELILVHPADVDPRKTDEGLIYIVRVDNYMYEVPARNMLHFPGLGFDGIKGRSVIAIQRDSLGLTKAAEIYGARFFGSGTNMDGVIEVPGEMSEPSYNRLRESWNEKYKGLMNSHSTPILEAGAVYKRIGIPPEDAQFLETRKFQLAEIARWYGVQPHLLMDLERSTNNNIEHQGMEFVTYTLAPEVANWESEMRRKLFRSDERHNTYVEFNLNALLRADSQARAEFYKGMFAVAAMNPNQIRKYENEPGYDGGDRFYVQAGYVPVELIDNVYQKKIENNETPAQPRT